jgi:D-alanyl-lipoteichoic acid acyltransferase DltB (MBOAT superfamily)
MTTPELLGVYGAYILIQRWVLGAAGRWKDGAFAVVNLLAVYLLYYSGGLGWHGWLFYIALVILQYLPFRWWGERTDAWGWVAFLTPILILAIRLLVPLDAWILAHVLPGWLADRVVPRLQAKLAEDPAYKIGAGTIGLSYLCFRTSYLVLEVRNRVVPRPGFWAYLGFALFAPTLSVGPISPYSEHRRGFSRADRPEIPVGRALLRILVGLVKLRFLASILNQLTYAGLLFDGVPHRWADLAIAAGAYYLFLYCNFSGYCDVAIGIAGLMGIPVAENFDWPFGARNLKEFWNRWHITLSHYMRDVVFTPLAKGLTQIFGPAAASHAVVLPIIVVFLLIGIWHGVTWPYAVFGLIQALGLILNHYYSLVLKKRLGRARLADYNRSRAVRAAAVALTNVYFGASLFFFANDSGQIRTILLRLRGQ